MAGSKKVRYKLPPKPGPKQAPASGRTKAAPAAPVRYRAPAGATVVDYRDIQQKFGLPPRERCDDCGAVASEDLGVVVSSLHAADCFYYGWPRRVSNVRPRPSMAKEWRGLPVSTCGVCRAVDCSGDVAEDRKRHLWWCSWWDAHPGITPF